MSLELEKFDQVGRERAREIVGDDGYMSQQFEIMKEWVAKNPGIEHIKWTDEGWSEAYYKAILSHDFYDNKDIAGKIKNLKLHHLEKFL